MTNRQRFSTGDLYTYETADGSKMLLGDAPFSLGAPGMLVIDYSVFKQTKEQKSDKIAFKWKHKLFMGKHGIDDKKFLNIPSNRIEKIVITT